MNTMVGLQASLHTSVSDGISELMRNDPLPALDDDDLHDDDDDDVFKDDFDADELLSSPLFNDSTDKIGRGLVDGEALHSFEHRVEQGSTQCATLTPDSSEEFGGSSHSIPSTYEDFCDDDMKPAASISIFHTDREQGSTSPLQSSPSTPTYVSPLLDEGQGTASLSGQKNIATLDHSQRRSPSQSQQHYYNHMGQQTSFGYGQTANEGYNSIEQQHQQQASFPSRAASFSEGPGFNHVANSHEVMNNHYPSQGMQGNLEQMQQFQQMQHVQRPRPLGLSQSMHGSAFRMNPRLSPTGMQNSLDSASFHGGSRVGSAHFPGYQSHGNVSIASHDMLSAHKSQLNNFDPLGESNHSQTPSTLNEAMEKLCESMKRSAMSRSLVKHLSSSRHAPSRSNSGSLMAKQRGVMRQGSNRSLMDDGSGRGTSVPILRLPNAKHHLQHPARSVYRHDSQQSLNAHSSHGINFQVDGRHMGTF